METSPSTSLKVLMDAESSPQVNGDVAFSDRQYLAKDHHVHGHLSESKRRRIARACDMCRKKKIKCDGKLPACTNCQNYHTKCVFTFVEKKRNPPKGAKYIEGLENRLERMESLLKLSGILPEAQDGKMDLSAIEKELSSKQRKQSTPRRNDQDSNQMSLYDTPESDDSDSMGSSPEAENTSEEGVEALSDMMCSLVTNNSGETRFIGSSSGFSIFSPRGIQWVNSKTGDKSFQQMLHNAARGDDKWLHWRGDVFDPLFAHRISNPLPSREEAKLYLSETLFEKYYSGTLPFESGWYASFNMMLAIGCRVRGAQSPNIEEEAKGWSYFQNAASVLTELTLKNTNLLSIQAMLAMALFLQGTANPQPSYFLVAAAVRVMHSIGMHRRSPLGDIFGFSKSESEQRRRCFWIAYLLDKDIALRSGRPPAINDDDINVELPEEEPADGLGTIELTGGRGKVNLFRLMCTFSQIASKVYMQIYSASAARQSDGELLSTIGRLDQELEAWKYSVPIDFRPEHEISDGYQNVLHVIVLHFAYYNCLTTIHRMSVQQGYWTSRLSNYAVSGLSARPINPRIFSSAALCVSAARASVHLIKYIGHRDNPCAWLILYYPVSALVTLFASILQNPQDPKASSDLQLMHVVVEFLTSLKGDDDEGNVGKLLYIAAEFDRIARLVLEKSHKEAAARRKRRFDENKLGDEVSRMNVTKSHIAAGDQNNQNSTTSALENDFSPRTRSPVENSVDDSLLDSTNNTEHGQPIFPRNYGMERSEGLRFPSHGTGIQEPFVPQSLWNLEWDWTDLGLGIHGPQTFQPDI